MHRFPHLVGEKIHLVTGVCFSPLTTGGTHQLLVSPTYEREEAYTRNKVYFLLVGSVMKVTLEL